MLLNDAGAILSSSDTIVVSESSANQYQSFYFPNPVSLSDATYYIGLGQVANTVTGFNPVGIQWEGDSVRDGAYYRSKSTADSLWESKSAGRPMIMAEVIPQSGSVKITGKLTLCPSESNLLTAVAIDKRFANKVIDFSSQHAAQVYSASNALGSPDVYPAYGLNGNSWTSASADSAANNNNGREYLVLQFPNPGHINFIEIFQTLNPGAIDSVYVKDPVNGYVNVYTHTAEPEDTVASIKRIDFAETSFDVSEVRIALNSKAVAGFNTIDAVAIGKESSAAFDTYLWTPGGETGSTKSVSSAGTYKVQVTTAAGCTFEKSVQVTSHVAVTPTITSYLKGDTLHTGAVSLCPGDSVILESSKLTGNTWSPGGATTRRIVVYGAGNYTVSYNDGSDCGNTTSSPVVVSINSLPTAAITGTLTICPGNSTTLDAGSHTSYLWNTGATTQTLSVSNPGDYSVIVSNAAGCKASTTATTTFTSLAAPTITGTLNFCEGTTTSLDAGTGYASYVWSSGQTTHNITVSTPGDYSVEVTNTAGCLASNSVTTQKFNNPVPTISGNTGFCPSGNVTLTATPGFVNYAWTPSGSGNTKVVSAAGPYMVTVTDGNGCHGSASRQIVQYPAPTPSVAGTLSFCGGSFTTLSAIGGSYSNYSWSTGETTPNISVSAVATYTITVTDINGCIASASATTSRTGQVPASPGPITGASIVTCSTTGVYFITAVPNTDHYVWTPPRGSTIISGQGGLSVTINFPANFQGGKLIVAASNACGQSNTLTERSLFIQSIPDAPGQIAGQANGDCNASRTFSINAVPIATSYTWSVPAGTTITSGQGGTSIILLFPNNFTFGNICVTANNGCGSSTQSCLQVTSVPAVPTSITGPTSICAGANGLVYSVPAVPGATTYTWAVPQGAQISSGQGTTSVVVKWGNREGAVTCIAKNVCANSASQSLAVAFTACFANNGGEPQVVIRPVPEVVSAYGGMASVRGILLEWTVGEPRVETENNRTILYTQGFHQPLILGRSNHDSISILNDIFNVTVYPNPVTSILSIKFETSTVEKVSIEIVDVLGRILQQKRTITGSRVEELSMRNYVPGSYFLVVKNEYGKIISTVKLLKLDK